jgi:hypothetical protein
MNKKLIKKAAIFYVNTELNDCKIEDEFSEKELMELAEALSSKDVEEYFRTLMAEYKDYLLNGIGNPEALQGD